MKRTVTTRTVKYFPYILIKQGGHLKMKERRTPGKMILRTFKIIFSITLTPCIPITIKYYKTFLHRLHTWFLDLKL